MQGFPDIMPKDYGSQLSSKELADLVAFSSLVVSSLAFNTDKTASRQSRHGLKRLASEASERSSQACDKLIDLKAARADPEGVPGRGRAKGRG